MRGWVAALLVAGMGVPGAGAQDTARTAALEAVDRQREELIHLSDEVWRLAETALREQHSAALLADYAERRGFVVERGVAGMPTAFVASFGEGRPILGVLGEYDALPGLSQQAVPRKEPRQPGGAGHGCGHNLFGAASLGAAVAIRDLIAAGELRGTIRFYGTPAEEAVGGKTYMVREGLFDDLDAALACTRTRSYPPRPTAARPSSTSWWSSAAGPPTRRSIRGTAAAPATRWRSSCMPST